MVFVDFHNGDIVAIDRIQQVEFQAVNNNSTLNNIYKDSHFDVSHTFKFSYTCVWVMKMEASM